MHINLHKNVCTTPTTCVEIAARGDSVVTLAARYHVGNGAIRSPEVFTDASHTAHRLQTILGSAQELIAVQLRKTLLLPLDVLLAVTREFLFVDVSRSGLDHCLRRHCVGNLKALLPQQSKETARGFKLYELGDVHVDIKYLPQMPGESQHRYLIVVIDPAKRWVFAQIGSSKVAANARAFLKSLHSACPIRISKVLTDIGKESTDRLFASRQREPSGQHVSDQTCQRLNIEHILIKPSQDAAYQWHG